MSVTLVQRPTYNGIYAKNEVPNFIFSTSDEQITATLTIQGNTFQASYTPDFNSQIEIDFSQLYADYIKTLMPDGSTNIVSQTNIGIICEASFAGSLSGTIPYASGNPFIWKVFNVNVNSSQSLTSWAASHFMTNQAAEKPTTHGCPEWLTYYDFVGSYVLKARFYPISGGNTDVTLKTDTVAGCFTVNVSYDRLIALMTQLPSAYQGYYDVILFDNSSNILCRQRYIYKERSGKEHYYLFANALGGIDTLIATGANTLQPDMTFDIGRFGTQHVALDDAENIRSWSQRALLPWRQRNWIWELLTMKGEVAKYEAATYTAIVITGASVSMADAGQLADVSFSYILSNATDAILASEEPDRSMHQSTANNAGQMEDITTSVVLSFADDGEGGYETEQLSMNADKFFIEFEKEDAYTTVIIFIDGMQEGTFNTFTDSSPICVQKEVEKILKLTTVSAVQKPVTIKYYK